MNIDSPTTSTCHCTSCHFLFLLSASLVLLSLFTEGRYIVGGLGEQPATINCHHTFFLLWHEDKYFQSFCCCCCCCCCCCWKSQICYMWTRSLKGFLYASFIHWAVPFLRSWHVKIRYYVYKGLTLFLNSTPDKIHLTPSSPISVMF